MTAKPDYSIFQHPVWAAALAFTAAFLWGWAYPLIKLGFAEFEIQTDMTGSKMLFDGIRFFTTFVWNYVLAAALTTVGIYVINKGKAM